MKDNYWILQSKLGSDYFVEQQEKHNLEHKQSSDKRDENGKQDFNLWRKEEQKEQPTQTQAQPNLQQHQQQQQPQRKQQVKLSVPNPVIIKQQELKQQDNNNSMYNNRNEDDKVVIEISRGNNFKVDNSFEEVKSNDECNLELQEDLKLKQKQQQQLKRDENDLNLSFCGCGFLGIYHVGVASCFHEYAPQLSKNKVAGSSAGSLVAVAYICGNLQLAYATTDILRTAIDARARALGPFHPSFDINATIREALERGLPDDVHLKASGKLHISLTRVYDGENVIISQFDSKEDVIQAIICSCFIPFWSGLKTPKFKGVGYVDGGFSNNLLILDDKTVSVSPFAGEADICPQDDTFNLLQISISNTSFSLSPDNLYRLSHALLPPRPEILSDLCEQGFADGIRFLQRMKLISCTKCLDIRSSLLVAADGGDMKEAFENQVKVNDSLNLTSSFNENHHHIRLEQQEQKTIEINEGFRRRDSIVSTTSQIYYQKQHQQQQEEQQLKQQRQQQQQPTEHCDECVLIRQKALKNQIPKQFSDRIRDACDTVNKSLSNWIYSHRPIKYLSYMAAPYYLPVEFSLALVYRCWRQLPSISPELVNCIYNIVDFLVGIIRRMNARSTSSLLLESSSNWEEDAIEYEKELVRQQMKISTSKITATSTMTTTTTTTTSTMTTKITKTKSSSSLVVPAIQASSSSLPIPARRSSLSLSSTGIESAAAAATVVAGGAVATTCECCMSCVNNNNNNCNLSNFCGVQTISSSTASSSLESSSISSLNKLTNNDSGCCNSCCLLKRQHQPTHKNHRSSSTNQLHSLEDTFDSIVDVTSNQEARIFAYYFRDAKNRLQVTEIFDFQRAESNSSINNGNNMNNQNTNNNHNNSSSVIRALNSSSSSHENQSQSQTQTQSLRLTTQTS